MLKVIIILYILKYTYIHIYIYIYIYVYMTLIILTILMCVLFTLLDWRVSSLRRGHANIICVAPSLTDDTRREPDRMADVGRRICLQK